MMNKYCTSRHKKQHTAVFGFTLIELLISMFVTAIVGGAIVSNYIVQQRAATKVRQVAHMQQQIRGAITVMSEDIRLAGLNRDVDDPNSPFGILNVGAVAIEDESGNQLTQANGQQTHSLTLAYDYNRLRPNIEENSRYPSPPTTMDGDLNEPYFEYRLYNEDNDGTLELARYVYDSSAANSPERQLLAENIEAIAFAYAIDVDEDGLLDHVDGRETNPIIWAADTDGNGVLDTNLDTNGDFLINEDDAGDDEFITSQDGAAGSLPSIPPRTSIRAVRIWLLACTGPAQNYEDTNRYVVGDRIYRPNEGDLPDNRRRIVMEHIVNCRNMWPTKHM